MNLHRIVLIAFSLAILTAAIPSVSMADEKKDRDGKPDGRPDGRPSPRMIFQNLDKNDDGKLGLREFSDFRKLEGADRQKIAERFEKIDKNGDDAIGPQEFMAVFESRRKPRPGAGPGRPGAGKGPKGPRGDKDKERGGDDTTVS